MTATTPPKGRPTEGKIDREATARAIHRRNQRAKILWIVLAVVIIALIIYFGSNSGGGGGAGGGGGGIPGGPTN